MMSNKLQEMERLAMEHEALRAQLAERDAEIERLQAELAGVIEGHKAAVELWQQQDYNNSTVIATLRQQVAELQAYKQRVIDADKRVIRRLIDEEVDD